MLAGVCEQRGELAINGSGREDAPERGLGKQVRMPFQRVAQPDEAVFLEAFLQGLRGVVEGGEVETHDDVASALGGGRATDIGIPEQVIELVRPMPPVVALQQRQPAGLAEAPGADEEDVALVFERAQVTGLVPRTASRSPGCAGRTSRRRGCAGRGGGHRHSQPSHDRACGPLFGRRRDGSSRTGMVRSRLPGNTRRARAGTRRSGRSKYTPRLMPAAGSIPRTKR